MTALAEHVDRYLTLRRALGYHLRDHDRLLGAFISFLEEGGEVAITTLAAVRFAQAASSEGAAAHRLSVVRAFAVYLSAFDAATEVPPQRLLPGGPPRRTPYLYSDEQVQALLRAARWIRPESFAATMATLLGLLAATGLRPGEAYRLDQADVDLDAGQLAVIDSKFEKSRLLPLHSSTVEALAHYAEARDANAHPTTDAFFPGRSGERIRPAEAITAFRRLCSAAEIAAPPGRRAPRLYDFRHRFAVQTLLDWHRAGLDVGRQLPVLSAYLGHLAPANTYWYYSDSPVIPMPAPSCA